MESAATTEKPVKQEVGAGAYVPPSSAQSAIRRLKAPLWPAVLATFAAALGFAGLKFVLIGELAYDFRPELHEPLPVAWMEELVQKCIAAKNVKEAITQGLAAVITLGVILGYLINAPLAGAWRCSRLFVVSGIGVGVGCLLTNVLNPWLMMLLVGIAYGAACAARGKTVPLLARAAAKSNTLISGLINASMVVGLLVGTISGMILYDVVDFGDDNALERWIRHGILAVFLGLSVVAGALVRPPEPRPIPFLRGAGELFGGTLRLFRRHWAPLTGGGMAWGIASAASLAIFVDASERIHLSPKIAVTLVLFPAIGAILGNLVSHWFSTRFHTAGAFLLMGVAVWLYPVLVQNYATAAVVSAVIGTLFASSANVCDARFLQLAAREGQAGRGSTLMSLIHSLYIFLVGSGLAVLLLLGVVSATSQFWIMALCSGVALVAALYMTMEGAPPRAGH